MPTVSEIKKPSKDVMAFQHGVRGIGMALQKYSRGKSISRLSKANARVARMKARDAKKRGGRKEAISRGETKQLVGSQRTSLAAQGINVTGGSARDVQFEAADIGEIEAMTIKNRALREAYGYETEVREAESRSKAARRAGKYGAMSSLITGGMKIAQTYR
jgi:hypothetical protein